MGFQTSVMGQDFVPAAEWPGAFCRFPRSRPPQAMPQTALRDSRAFAIFVGRAECLRPLGGREFARRLDRGAMPRRDGNSAPSEFRTADAASTVATDFPQLRSGASIRVVRRGFQLRARQHSEIDAQTGRENSEPRRLARRLPSESGNCISDAIRRAAANRPARSPDGPRTRLEIANRLPASGGLGRPFGRFRGEIVALPDAPRFPPRAWLRRPSGVDGKSGSIEPGKPKMSKTRRFGLRKRRKTI